MRIASLTVALVAALAVAGTPGVGAVSTVGPEVQPAERPTFRASVDLVSVAAVVRDRHGRIVRDLDRDDFLVFDAGVRRRIVEFSPAEDGPVSVAILFDTSGSMRESCNLDHGRAVIEQVLGLLRPGRDEVAFYAFDSGLRRVSNFTSDPDLVRRAAGAVEAFGATALYDAVGEIAATLEQRPNRRRAVVLITDGLDTRSQRTAAQVSSIASASDVPIYVVTVGPGEKETLEGPNEDYDPTATTPTAHLGNLAYWTGGALFNGRGTAASGAVARLILAELRHQYLLAFESAGPGWRPVDVRLRRGEVTVRTRSAYQSSRPS